eukprot:INCI16191.8.p1 GENE.INCI16191.8~~INCI16191.8.p1  ORF type:complete len:119 (-),score=4.98 INCI16191.8:211-567(-)
MAIHRSSRLSGSFFSDCVFTICVHCRWRARMSSPISNFYLVSQPLLCAPAFHVSSAASSSCRLCEQSTPMYLTLVLHFGFPVPFSRPPRVIRGVVAWCFRARETCTLWCFSRVDWVVD